MQDVEVPVSGGSIKLGQFIKLAGLVATGGEAKAVISEGLVTVNGETDTRRGRHLAIGDHDGEDDSCDEATADDDFDPEKWRNM